MSHHSLSRTLFENGNAFKGALKCTTADKFLGRPRPVNARIIHIFGGNFGKQDNDGSVLVDLQRDDTYVIGVSGLVKMVLQLI